MPPERSQIVLSVGEPVIMRETSELIDSEACTPQITRRIPTTSKAIEMPRYMGVLDSKKGGAQSDDSAPLDDTN
jgi:hypothetical protein